MASQYLDTRNPGQVKLATATELHRDSDPARVFTVDHIPGSTSTPELFTITEACDDTFYATYTRHEFKQMLRDLLAWTERV